MKRRAIAALVLGAATLALGSASWVGGAAGASSGPARQYVVLAEPGASQTAVRAAVRKARGRVVRSNSAIGLLTVVSRNPNFARAATATAAIRSAGRNRPFGRSFATRHKRLDLAQLDRALGSSPAPGLPPARSGDDHEDGDDDHSERRRGDPFAPLQWDMQMIHAAGTRSHDSEHGDDHEGDEEEGHGKDRGDKKVLVGVIDSGIDGSHPDIAPNFDRALSRNFAPDIAGLDAGCGTTPAPCLDPADVDGDTRDGHGTHVAGTIGAALNGLGMSGVAPNVTLVNLRAMQDSGYFFLQPTLDAMTFAADNGIDVVNMSYFTDPWLYNCRSNPADSKAEQIEQSLIIDATQRAADYARAHGVTLVSALGNDATDLGHPTNDPFSPDFPGGTERYRVIDNSCVDVPAETNGVISVSSLGPSGAKSDFSNYGVEQTDLSAPGGFLNDFPGTSRFRTTQNQILSTYPQSVAVATKKLNPDGTPNTPDVLRDCRKGVCAYYQYLQGSSMASPHVAGVAALIVSRFGSKSHGPGISMDPVEVERILKETATDVACPTPSLVTYPATSESDALTALCEGTPAFNGFYGHGIVDARAAVNADSDRGDRDGHGDGHDRDK